MNKTEDSHEKTSLLKTIENINKKKRYVCEHTFPELTALCPITKLPDFYTLKIVYEPDERIVELKSLKIYLVEYQNVEIYHEELINKILDDIKKIIEPRWILLELKVNVRGGIYTTVKRFWSKEEGDDIKKAIGGI